MRQTGILLICLLSFFSKELKGQNKFELDKKLIQTEVQKCDLCLENSTTNDEMINCYSNVTFVYDSLSKFYFKRLRNYLKAQDKQIIERLYSKNDSMKLWTLELNKKLLNNKSYGLGDEARISAALITQNVAKSKYELFYSYVISICERSEEPCTLDRR